MCCVANLMTNIITLFKIYHRHTFKYIIVTLLQLQHVSNKIMLLVCYLAIYWKSNPACI